MADHLRSRELTATVLTMDFVRRGRSCSEARMSAVMRPPTAPYPRLSAMNAVDLLYQRTSAPVLAIEWKSTPSMENL